MSEVITEELLEIRPNVSPCVTEINMLYYIVPQLLSIKLINNLTSTNIKLIDFNTNDQILKFSNIDFIHIYNHSISVFNYKNEGAMNIVLNTVREDQQEFIKLYSKYIRNNRYIYSKEIEPDKLLARIVKIINNDLKIPIAKIGFTGKNVYINLEKYVCDGNIFIYPDKKEIIPVVNGLDTNHFYEKSKKVNQIFRINKELCSLLGDLELNEGTPTLKI